MLPVVRRAVKSAEDFWRDFKQTLTNLLMRCFMVSSAESSVMPRSHTTSTGMMTSRSLSTQLSLLSLSIQLVLACKVWMFANIFLQQLFTSERFKMWRTELLVLPIAYYSLTAYSRLDNLATRVLGKCSAHFSTDTKFRGRPIRWLRMKSRLCAEWILTHWITEYR